MSSFNQQLDLLGVAFAKLSNVESYRNKKRNNPKVRNSEISETYFFRVDPGFDGKFASHSKVLSISRG